jgi:hypothetical protein
MSLNPLKYSEHWSLRTRLALVAVLSLVLGLIPSGLLLMRYVDELDVVRGETAGLPLNRAWQDVLVALQQQREAAAEALSTRPEAKAQVTLAAKATQQALAQVKAALPAAHLEGRFDTRLDDIISKHAQMLAAFDSGQLDVPRVLTAQWALAIDIFEVLDEINATTGLLLDPEASSYFVIIAGLQMAPRAQDALSELSSLARAAAVDDLAVVSATLTRFREYSSMLQQHLRLAVEADGGVLKTQLGPVLESARRQREQVDETMNAAAKDVNFPLDQLSAKLSQGAELQRKLANDVVDILEDALRRRAAAAAVHRNVLLVLAPLLLGLMVLVIVRSIRQLLTP